MKARNVLMLIAFAMCCVTIVAQPSERGQEIAKNKTPPTAEAPAPAAPAFKADDLLKIRDVQYRHAQRVAQMKVLEQQYTKLQTDQDADGQKVDQIIRDAAKAANIDLTKWSFDIEELKFVPRENRASETGPPKTKSQSPN